MLAMMVVQVILGISTLVMNMPIALATAHQGGAILLLTASLFVTHSLVMGNAKNSVGDNFGPDFTTEDESTLVHSGRM